MLLFLGRVHLYEGVYAAPPGPHYETPRGIRMLRATGPDCVPTALEAIAARRLGARAARTSARRVGTLLASLLPYLSPAIRGGRR